MWLGVIALLLCGMLVVGWRTKTSGWYGEQRVVVAMAANVLYTLYASTPLGLLYHRREERQWREGSDGERHSICSTTEVGPDCRIVPVPMMSDNYAYLIIDKATDQVAVVDPSVATEVVAQLREQELSLGKKLQLSHILCTHKHWDHAGGNADLQALYPTIQVPLPVPAND
jgi:paroxysmal nonkinesiogenic dyskinesia protein